MGYRAIFNGMIILVFRWILATLLELEESFEHNARSKSSIEKLPNYTLRLTSTINIEASSSKKNSTENKDIDQFPIISDCPAC